MRTLRRFSATAALLVGGLALSAPNDFRIQLLGNPNDPMNGGVANANFKAFAKELGAALTSMNLTPPGTLGHSGFSVSAELSVAALKAVTPGATPPQPPFFFIPTEGNYTGPTLLPSLHIRKGLPWSFEIGTRVGWIDRSNMTVATLEAKWAGNEGFAYLPDVAVRFHATRLFNTRGFELGAGGVDFSVGKKWAIGGMITLTPYGGWDLVFVGANTNRLLDFQPDRTEAQAYSSQYAQLSNSGAYKEVVLLENAHNRFYAGGRFVGGVIQILAEVSASGLGSITIPGTSLEQQLPPVLSFNTAIGLDF